MGLSRLVGICIVRKQRAIARGGIHGQRIVDLDRVLGQLAADRLRGETLAEIARYAPVAVGRDREPDPSGFMLWVSS